MKRFLLIAINISLHMPGAFSQTMLGISNSNYAGNAGMNLNPASMLYLPSRWEIGLLTVNVQAENNFVGIPRHPFSHLTENGSSPHAGLNDYFNGRSKSAGMHTLVKIPSFIFKVNEWGFAFSTALRSDLSIHRVDPVLAKVMWEGMNYSPMHGRTADLSGINLASLTWMESSISVGKQLTKGDRKRWYFAVTGKYITGIGGANIHLNSGSVSFANDTLVSFNDVEGTMGYGTLSSPSQLAGLKLNGIGADVGVCFVSNPYVQKFSNGRPVPTKRYEYRLGFSLVDLGYVHFTANSRSYKINSPLLMYGNVQHIKVEGQEGFDSLMLSDFTSGSRISNSYTMALPLAASVQYDRCLHPRWYANLTVVQRLPLPFAHVRRANCLSASIRYETPYFEIALPYSLYDYYRHRIGLSMRYHFIFIGTDRLGTFYGKRDITGLDVYFGIKLQSIEFKHKKKGGKVIRCAAYN